MTGTTGKILGVILIFGLGAASGRWLLPGPAGEAGTAAAAGLARKSDPAALTALPGTASPGAFAPGASHEALVNLVGAAGSPHPVAPGEAVADTSSRTDASAPPPAEVEEITRRNLAMVEASIQSGVLAQADHRELMGSLAYLPREQHEKVLSALTKAINQGRIKLEAPL